MRVRQAALTLGVVGALAGGGGALATEPRQPATPEQIIDYRTSGEWDADITTVVDEASDYLRDNARVRRPAIVLDIDDTSLSSYDCLRGVDFDRAALGDSCAQSAEMPAIPQTLALFQLARSEGVSVFFITGRRSRQRAATVRNLRAEGYTGTWSLMLRPNRQPRSQRAGWKARVRRSLARRGYEVVVNVGDQWSDLRGGGAAKTFKLPNPMYTIPVA